MSWYQHPEEQGSFVVPTVEVTDYDYLDPELEDYEAATTGSQAHHASASSKSSGKRRGKESYHSGSDTERDSPDMSPRSSKQPSSSKRHSGSSKSRSKTKTDDWTDVTEPEERRRIQNRIAQRKFREKAREQKEQAQRDMQNQEHAVNAYRIPGPEDLGGVGGQDEDVSGLPWGSFSMQYIVARGHESASQQGNSRRASDQQRSSDVSAGAGVGVVQQYMNPYADGYGQQVASFDGRDNSSGDDAVVYEESPYFYDYETTSPGGGQGYGHAS